ncbi:Conserved_hypothetical protein [Hexamita inflata]|uniref:Uncharacterized protein n=1 Tax=Hexamita inflata TaxID=28002 RepID=A0AA86PFJ1_9EUKA|nr:Conserved hypothetical protein [Hexamita inflata]
MDIDQRIKRLPQKYIAMIDKMKVGDLVSCLHLIIACGEEYTELNQHIDQLKQTDIDFNELSPDINQLQSQNIELDAENQRLKANLDFQTKCNEETTNNMEKALDKANSSLLLVSFELKEKDAELQLLRNQCFEFQKEIGMLRNLQVTGQSDNVQEIQSLKQQLFSLQHKNEELQNSLESTMCEKETETLILSEKDKLITSLKAQNEILKTSINQLSPDEEKYKNENTVLRSELKSALLKSSPTELKNKCELLEQDLNKKIQQQSQKIKDLEAELQQYKNNSQNASVEEIKDLKQDLNEIKQQLQNNIINNKELQSENEQLKNEVQQLHESLVITKIHNKRPSENLKQQDLDETPSLIQQEDHYSQIYFGQLQKCDQHALNHVVYLLLNQNYNLSNLLKQQYQSESSIIDTFSHNHDATQSTLIKQLITVIENQRDLIVEKDILNKAFANIYEQLKQVKNGGFEQNSELQQQDLQFKIKILQKKLEIENITKISAEDLVKNKYCLSTVYYQSLCQFYEQILQESVSQHVAYAMNQSGHVQMLEQHTQQQTSSQLLQIVSELVQDKQQSEVLQKNLIQLQTQAPNKIKLIPSKFDEELRSILRSIQTDLTLTTKQLMQKRSESINNQILKQTNSKLTQLILGLIPLIPSSNNNDNLHQLILDSNLQKNQILVQCEEKEQKVNQLKAMNKTLQSQMYTQLKQLNDKFNVLMQAADNKKLDKLQNIIVQQQKIITDQQKDLDALTTIQYENKEVQVDTGEIRLNIELKRQVSELKQLNEDLISKYQGDSTQWQEKCVQLQAAHTDYRLKLTSQLKQILEQVQSFNQPYDFTFKIKDLSDRLFSTNQVMKDLVKLLIQQQIILSKQKQYIQIKNVQVANFEAQAGSSLFSVQTAQTQVEISFNNQFTQIEQKQTNDQFSQTEGECLSCKKLIQLYVIEKSTNEAQKAQLDSIHPKYEQLIERNAKNEKRVKNNENLLHMNVRKLVLAKKDLKHAQNQISGYKTEIISLNKDNQVLCEELKNTQKELKNQIQRVQQKQLIDMDLKKQKITIQELEIEVNKYKTELFNKNRDLKVKQDLINEGTQIQDELKKQILKQLHQIKNLKKKFNNEDKKAMNSILTEEDIDMIFM